MKARKQAINLKAGNTDLMHRYINTFYPKIWASTCNVLNIWKKKTCESKTRIKKFVVFNPNQVCYPCKTSL